MKRIFIHSTLLILTFSLTACSYFSAQQGAAPTTDVSPEQQALTLAETTAGTQPIGDIGGNIASSMTADDKINMSRALDKATGKASSWTSANGTSYTVLPIKKVIINGNSLCRIYTANATRGGRSQEFNGTACITADGGWHEVRN